MIFLCLNDGFIFVVETNNTRKEIKLYLQKFKTFLKTEKTCLSFDEYKPKILRDVLIQIVSDDEKNSFLEKQKRDIRTKKKSKPFIS